MDRQKTNWFPGHMARAFSVFKNEIKKAHITIEVIDARIPASSRNSKIFEVAKGKNRIVILNKLDLVPRSQIKEWENKITRNEGARVISTNLATDRSAIKKVLEALNEAKNDIQFKKSMTRSILKPLVRVVIIGIPNVGKSTLINRLSGQNRTRVGKRPGITLGQQWISFGENYELLDMPGILEPNLEHAETAQKLSMTYAISDKVVDAYDIAVKLVELLKAIYTRNEPDKSHPLFKDIIEKAANGHEALSMVAQHYNYYLQSKKIDCNRAASRIIKDYRDGLLGKFILDENK